MYGALMLLLPHVFVPYTESRICSARCRAVLYGVCLYVCMRTVRQNRELGPVIDKISLDRIHR